MNKCVLVSAGCADDACWVNEWSFGFLAFVVEG